MGLRSIDHIVVLVLENRSFDHMLGYLSLVGYQGADENPLDGLRPGMSNAHQGQEHRIFELASPRFSPGPHHSHDHVLGQLEGGNQGFVSDYATVLGVRRPGDVMGYHSGSLLRVFDSLVRQFAVCDRWFSSFPGPTWPNRFFLMAGHSAGVSSNLDRIEVETVFDHLTRRGVPWRYYSHDVAFLRAVEHFTFSTGKICKIRRFHEDLARGELPAVAWIDPNFTVQGVVRLPDDGNDDHPPADVRNGQSLVADVYNALLSNPEIWSRTLLVITYDEHGGFFDHVSPPERPERAPGGDPRFCRFGVRVPAIVVSPWVRRGTVWSGELEHTSILQSILRRFCAEGGAIPDMGARVSGAPDLGPLLDAPAARTDCLPVERMTVAEGWMKADPDGSNVAAFTGQPEPGPPSDLQERLQRVREMALAHGVPEDEM
jgi:phospholipase C